ncbi:hypothetical protein BKG91_07825 [Rodentibacter caecimuris]|uniref:Uncharacterized protein n=1 Tax=Rodentibacter caecimuris TaxID=1796644 RepID=A0AAJ3K532_9PAST|nr:MULTISPECIES: hypothetical protein [Pasteurellaceae]AOF53437.1 hypothetical protein AC062_1344 [Pasteurellaceae bacterium NI1060]MCR1838033.1 hypothetical protein [Pasteurella caecimuris]MCU0107654.1 hypothetical protein [Pasteurella caecimuris]OOF71727.1 hypothetical protein BKG90_07230 [Rodentibacter heylii]OOF73912.1 hypothetical protein BKG91_07825 [Rodentibacter heylii]
MLTTNDLSKKEQRELRRWFTKIDEDTIELKIKGKGIINVVLIILALIPSLYYDFIKPSSSELFWNEIHISFNPNVYFEQQYRNVVSKNNPNMTIWNETKEEYINNLWQWREGLGWNKWDGYLNLAWYVILLGIIFWPTKRRVRFDRKRGIIYTYINKKFYLMEVNKLARPLPECFINTGGGIVFWLPPFKNTTPFLKHFPLGSMVFVSDYSMYLFELGSRVFLIPNAYKKSRAPILKKSLVDFMNPNIAPQRLSQIVNTLEAPKGLKEHLYSFLFGWIDEGLYTRNLPKQERLENMITGYFKENAPQIRVLPSYRMAYENEVHKFWGAPFLVIVNQEQNRKEGFIKVPCPDLYEYPKVSMHRPTNMPDPEWGNVKGKEV